MTACTLAASRCHACEGGVAALDEVRSRALLAGLHAWHLKEHWIEKTYCFANHYEAMAFVNLVAWVSHRTDHHPEIVLGYKDVVVRYWTHAIGGLSENDFICAAKIEKLLEISG